uniref:Uncharacterized protein n=1 Tax=Populus trichocarpa TaxID=3694 RepID=B9H0K0_POPTR
MIILNAVYCQRLLQPREGDLVSIKKRKVKSNAEESQLEFSSHNSWISACKWHTKSLFHLLSAFYDGKVMLWDLRTAWPLVIIDSHEDKVLCADWWKGDSVISGGVDSKLCISSGISVQ